MAIEEIEVETADIPESPDEVKGMEYNDLQSLGSDLGLSVIGVGRDELEEQVIDKMFVEGEEPEPREHPQDSEGRTGAKVRLDSGEEVTIKCEEGIVDGEALRPVLDEIISSGLESVLDEEGDISGEYLGGEEQEDTVDVQELEPEPEPVEEEPESDLEDVDMVTYENIYLVTTTGCMGCEQAKDGLSEWIDDGTIEVIDIQESDLAADLAVDLGLTQAPSLVIEVEEDEYQVV